MQGRHRQAGGRLRKSEEWWWVGGQLAARSHWVERNWRDRQSASAFPPANIASHLHTTKSLKGEHLILLIWPRLHQFCKREREKVGNFGLGRNMFRGPS